MNCIAAKQKRHQEMCGVSIGETQVMLCAPMLTPHNPKYLREFMHN